MALVPHKKLRRTQKHFGSDEPAGSASVPVWTTQQLAALMLVDVLDRLICDRSRAINLDYVAAERDQMAASSSSDYAYHYRKWFNDSDAFFASMSTYYQRRLRYYGVPKPGHKVLEIGCGWGFCLGGLRDLGITDAAGYDIDPVAIDLCKRRGLNATLLVLADIHSFMADRIGTYDTILAFDVLEHIPLMSRADVLRDILRALKPGGVFVCQVPNADSMIASHMRYVDHTHVVCFTQSSLDAELHNAGFEPARIMDADPPPPRPSVRQIHQLKWWLIRLAFRKTMRAIYVAELGSEGYRVPLDKNITAIAARPSKGA